MTPIEKANELVSMYLWPQRRFKELAMDKELRFLYEVKDELNRTKS